MIFSCGTLADTRQTNEYLSSTSSKELPEKNLREVVSNKFEGPKYKILIVLRMKVIAGNDTATGF